MPVIGTLREQLAARIGPFGPRFYVAKPLDVDIDAYEVLRYACEDDYVSAVRRAAVRLCRLREYDWKQEYFKELLRELLGLSNT